MVETVSGRVHSRLFGAVPGFRRPPSCWVTLKDLPQYMEVPLNMVAKPNLSTSFTILPD